MAGGIGKRGWWISPEGASLPVTEHRMFVAARPDLFGEGLARDARGSAAPADRARVLAAAMRAGWIRVREHGDHVALEAWDLDPAARARMCAHLDRDGASDDDRLRLGEVRTGRVDLRNVGTLRHRVDAAPEGGRGSGGTES